MAGREHLAALGIDEAGITAEVLLRHALNVTRAQLYMAWDRPLDEGAWVRFQELLEARVRGRPVAYIVGHREFMGLDFQVDERVLIPRPETETLVEAVLDAVRDVRGPTVADIGTGSGAVAVSVAVRRRDALVIATDLSADALAVARANAAAHGVTDRVRFLEGDLVSPVRAAGVACDAVACNPPYVTPEVASGLPREIREFEPRLAIVSPGQGENLHARLVREAPAVLRSGGWLMMEVAAGQAGRVVELVTQSGLYEPPHVRRDGLGWERVVAARVRTSPPTEAEGELLSSHVRARR
ncbi:MAG: peptide chain release factor N(5)-glutamine methyltransferase [Armatimonadota bacterium]|nr:peptide chain release factor N(5)-glutamine methyltransferase [Armatimonadota bacterium]